jgi:type II secretory ATPase GspE/PulE/Tfp pilus assembly ATPase PilB-like protein
MNMKKYNKIVARSLVDNNVLSAKEIDSYLAEAEAKGEPLKDYLLEHGLVTERQLLIALSQTYHMETVDLTNIVIPQDLIKKIPVKFVAYYQFMPLSEQGNVLSIASAFPLDVKIQDEIRMHLGKPIKVFLSLQTQINECIRLHYGLASDMLDKIIHKDPDQIKDKDTLTGAWIEDLEQTTQDPTVASLVNQIILEAYKKRATDIHIEPYRHKVRFRYRIDGVLIDANVPKEVKHFLPMILSRIKILANLSITEKRLPQDGSAVVKTKDQHLDLRVSTMPTPRGESMVIRILPTKVMHLSLEQLGFDTASEEHFRKLIQKPHGIIFMTGPTGSGKTTSLYACLNEINSPDKKIITIEDPIEYEMEGITQIQVNAKINFGFSTGLRNILRHDPDIIMVGEVRDVETAEIAVRTALTGHLVFSTLHTNDSASGITRLIDMGVGPYLITSSVEAFIAQRLVRLICPKCKAEDKDPAFGLKKEIAASLHLKDTTGIRLYKGKGCDYCNRTGYYGRVAIYEILVMNDAIRAAILDKPRSDYIKRVAMEQGLVTLRQNGWKAVLEGITTPSEIMNVTASDAPLQDYDSHKAPLWNMDPVKSIQKVAQMRIKKSQKWEEKNTYDSRSYPRIFEPVEIRYRLLKTDPNDANYMLSDNVEYKTVAEDISAGGLRFRSKGAFPVGAILDLRIQLGDGKKSIDCLARVCRMEEDELNNIYTVVNYYLDLSSKDKVSISKFVEDKLKLIDQEKRDTR